MSHKIKEYIHFLIKMGKTEEWIAKKSGISQTTVNRIKNGKIRYPRIHIAENIEKTYQKYGKSN